MTQQFDRVAGAVGGGAVARDGAAVLAQDRAALMEQHRGGTMRLVARCGRGHHRPAHQLHAEELAVLPVHL